MAFKIPDHTETYYLWESSDGDSVVTSMNYDVGLSACPMTYENGKTYYPDYFSVSAITAEETVQGEGRVDYNHFDKDNVFYHIHVEIDALSGNTSSVIKSNATTAWTNNPFESIRNYVKVRLDDNYNPIYSFITEGYTRQINFVDPDDPNVTHTGYGLSFRIIRQVPGNITKFKDREYTLYLNEGVLCCYWFESEEHTLDY